MTVVLDDEALRVTGAGPYGIEGRTVTRDERAGHWLVDGEPGIAAGTKLRERRIGRKDGDVHFDLSVGETTPH